MKMTWGLCAVLLLSNLQASDWEIFRGNTRDGIVPNSKVNWTEDGPKILWKAELGISSFVIGESHVYTMGFKDNKDFIYALEKETGKEAWTYSYPATLGKRLFEGGPGSTPTLSGGKLYTVGYEGVLLCLDAKTGEKQWENHLANDFKGEVLKFGFSCSPLVVGEKLILEVGAPGGTVMALNKDTGEVIWKSGSRKRGYGSPMLFKEKTLLIFDGTGLTGYQVEDGKELWHHPWKTKYDINAALPLVFGDKILISSAYKHGGAMLDLSSGSPKELWMNPSFLSHFVASNVVDGHAYAYCGNSGRKNHLRCFDITDGKMKWEVPSAIGSFIQIGTQLVGLTEKGELVLVQPDSTKYNEVGRVQLLPGRTFASAAFAGGLYFARNNMGRAVCVDLR